MNILGTFNEYISLTKTNKKYLLIFIMLTSLMSLYLFYSKTSFMHPKMIAVTIALTLILGIFCILYYFNHKNELHKVAFVTILCFGVIFLLLAPAFNAPDEIEHFVRSEITSEGVLFPGYVDAPVNYSGTTIHGKVIPTIQGANDLMADEGSTFFNLGNGNNPINKTTSYFFIGFIHNPFFGYLAQGIGIFIAKLFNLDNIWMLWLARFANLVLYASLISIAIKKTPILKIPMLFIALLPLAIFQGASVSIDATINGLGFVIIAYFFYMLKSPKESLDLKDITIFSVLVLLISLTKVTYLAFALLILFVPKDRFKNKYYYNIIAFASIIVLTLIWSKYSVQLYDFSRYPNYIQNNVNSTAQMNYLLSSPILAVKSVFNIFLNVWPMYNGLFFFYMKNGSYHSDLLGIFGLISLTAVIFLYPLKENISIRQRLYAFFIAMVIFVGTYVIQMLKWTPVGDVFNIQGVQVRYFIPIIPLLPFIFGFNKYKDSPKIDDIIMLVSVFLISSTVILTLFSFY